MQYNEIKSAINAIHKLPEEALIIENNKIKIDILWKNESIAMEFVKRMKPVICRNIRINHYLWIRYIASSCQEMEDRICIFPPHRAIEENVIADQRKY